jgi:phosphohistidine swiveling domain-containing protein
MIIFQDKQYQLFFSNNLQPLRALNYADELFFDEFERLCGGRYRILSIIRNGWQEKYGLQSDIDILQQLFANKLTNEMWSTDLLSEYEQKKVILVETLAKESAENHTTENTAALADTLIRVRRQSASLDAMSNMLHLFSSLVGGDFMNRLKNYTSDVEVINQNFIFYTQPIRESRYAKLLMPDLPDAISLSPADKNLSDMLRVGAFIKDDVSSLLEERGTMLASLFEEIARRLAVSTDDLYYLTLVEIADALNHGKSVADLSQDRKDITVLYYPDKKLLMYEGASAETMLKDGGFSEIAAMVAEHSQLHGQVASLGKASGRAVVVKNSDEAMVQVREGDVLVAPYTAPEYLPAMRKVVAIVTETGGITSHAAIVSREMKIPCVIAVPNVTSILHTGDMIEVDADAGTISVLE